MPSVPRHHRSEQSLTGQHQRVEALNSGDEGDNVVHPRKECRRARCEASQTVVDKTNGRRSARRFPEERCVIFAAVRARLTVSVQ